MAKVAENALFWRIFVGTAKKRENEACYISVTVVTVVYEVSGGTFAAPQGITPGSSPGTPPGSRLKQRPYPNEKFFIFFSKNEVGGKYRKKLNFFFLYIFLFIIYIYNI